MEKNEKTKEFIRQTKSPKNMKKIQEKYMETITNEIAHGKKVLSKLEKNAKKNIDDSRHQYSESIKSHSTKLKQSSLEAKEKFEKKSPRVFKKIKNGFFGFFEQFIGSIKIGTQYGNASLEILEKIAKLKELGIITEKEFVENKKRILKRI